MSAVVVSQPVGGQSVEEIIVGCQDGKIRIYNSGSSNPLSVLTGHTETGMFGLFYFVHFLYGVIVLSQ